MWPFHKQPAQIVFRSCLLHEDFQMDKALVASTLSPIQYHLCVARMRDEGIDEKYPLSFMVYVSSCDSSFERGGNSDSNTAYDDCLRRSPSAVIGGKVI